MSHNNLSDSYIFPYRIKLNEDGSIPGGGLKRCSEHAGVSTIANTTIKGKPEYVVVEWEHLLSGKVYGAKVALDTRTSEWLKKPPFNEYEPDKDVPSLIVQWRGHNKVVVMLVASFTRFSKGSIDLGEAVGKEIPKPNWGPKLYLSYIDYRYKPGDEYRIGGIRNYDRKNDPTLSRKQRYGCPRLQNGNIDESQLPPEKLPFYTNKDGNYVPCLQYFCEDKQTIIDEIRKLGWNRYPKDKQPPPIVFQDAPNPRPAW